MGGGGDGLCDLLARGLVIRLCICNEVPQVEPRVVLQDDKGTREESYSQHDAHGNELGIPRAKKKFEGIRAPEGRVSLPRTLRLDFPERTYLSASSHSSSRCSGFLQILSRSRRVEIVSLAVIPRLTVNGLAALYHIKSTIEQRRITVARRHDSDQCRLWGNISMTSGTTEL